MAPEIAIVPGGAPEPDGPANFPQVQRKPPGAKSKRRSRGGHGGGGGGHDSADGPSDELNLTAMMDMMTIILVFLLKSYSSSALDVKAGADLQLAASSTKLPPIDAITITITRKAVLIDNKPIVEVRQGSVDPSAKREGANGYLIDPIWVRLQKQADFQKTLVRQGKLKEFKGQAIVVADKQVPFRLLSEVIYSAGQAEFHSFKFLVIKKSG
jgi:biopolymer transport protein ExbD